MTTYIFKTAATMKPYNYNKYWIDNNIIKDYTITAANIPEALQLYKDHVLNDAYINITNNGLKNKSPMYIDTAAGATQKGYVITAAAEFQNDNYTWTKQFIDLWVEIITTVNTTF